ncbi:hypothetical protein HAX54_034503 [Datura stramonium]|uniref:Uncharacterized protein n=1 Tax=Datura stramonium TaxID=4076 RepID=A0ABS8VHS4_DATST|nr:hypothetical protein [Datura stramonium]
MNELASQVVSQTTETNTSPTQAIVDDDIFKWEIEEEVIGELIVDVFLKGEKLEKVHLVRWVSELQEERDGFGRTRPAKCEAALVTPVGQQACQCTEGFRIVGGAIHRETLRKPEPRLVADVN